MKTWEKKPHTHTYILEHLNRGVNEWVAHSKRFTGVFLLQLPRHLFCHQKTLSIILWCTEALDAKCVFLKVCFHSSVTLICSNRWQLVSGKKEKGKKNKTQSFLVLHQDPRWKLEEEHTYTSVSPCYHDALRTGLYRVPGMGILQEEYATARGPLMKILWPVSFVLFQITDREQKPGPQWAKNLKHCQLQAAGCFLCMPGKKVRQVYLFGLQKTVTTSNLKIYACFL